MSRQKLGQHFLDNPAWQHRIAEKLPRVPTAMWIEIGAGHGQMTRHLALAAHRSGLAAPAPASARVGQPSQQQNPNVIAIETDPSLAQNLRTQIAAHPAEWPGVEIAEGDVLSLDLLALARGAGLADNENFRVYGNLPYYITSPILHHLFQWAGRIASIHIVVQLEVAERIVAKPGSRDRGYLSVACQYYAHSEIALKIPRGAFRPPPNVDSALVVMHLPGERASLATLADDAFLRFVQTCFAHKRKTLRNNLLALAPDEAVRNAIVGAGLSPRARAEEVSLHEFAALASQFASSSPVC